MDLRTVSESPARWSTAIQASNVALPQGPSLRSGLGYPGPSSLNWPHPPRSQAHHDFAAQRLMGDAFAVRERLATRERFRAFADHSVLACCPLRPRGVRRRSVPDNDIDI